MEADLANVGAGIYPDHLDECAVQSAPAHLQVFTQILYRRAACLMTQNKRPRPVHHRSMNSMVPG
ncbi:hypothetical protein D9M71_412480 [compost metagenome]